MSANSYLLRGGQVYTMDPDQPWAQCVVVRGKMITYVGPEIRAASFTDPGTEVIDIDGGMVLPGFIDAHNHLAGSGAMAKVGVEINGLPDPAEMVARIRGYAASHPGSAVIRGSGWMAAYFENNSPTREMLDEAVSDRPAAILSSDSHDLWFNTAAMHVCGLDRSTEDPDPGAQYYVRDAAGWPSGHAVEVAPIMTMLAALGAFTVEGIRDAQELTLVPAPSWGITGYLEAGILLGPNQNAEPVYEDLVERDNAGQLPVRIVGTVWTRQPDDDPASVVATLTDWNKRIKSEHLTISVLKMWADGTAFNGGALLLAPFEDSKDGSPGQMTFPPDHIERQIELTQLAGFDSHIHIDADGSARVVLDAIEAVQRRHGRGTARHTVCHNTIVHPADVKRFAELGVIANCTPLWGTDYDGSFYDTYLAKLGAERMEERLYPYGDLVRSGALVTYGSDIPGVRISEIAPLTQIEAAVTRKRPGFPDDRALVPRQRVDLHDALRGYTINGAYQLRLDDIAGSLEAGKHADLTMLAKNLFGVAPEEIHSVPVKLTMMDGRITHDTR
jgi:predicted amidohydrolase YtcJ